jgi:hypothetical protein
VIFWLRTCGKLNGKKKSLCCHSKFLNSLKIPFCLDWRNEKPCVQQACQHENAQQASRSHLKGEMEGLSAVFENRPDPAVTGAEFIL